MAELASAYIRIRPSLAPEHRAALEDLSVTARKLADGIDGFLAQFAVPPEIEEKTE